MTNQNFTTESLNQDTDVVAFIADCAIPQIALHTDRNEHNEAAITLSEQFSEFEAINKSLLTIKSAHEFHGYMTSENVAKRDSYTREMLSAIESAGHAAVAQAVRSSL